MIKKVSDNIKALYERLKTERSEYLPLWQEIAKYIAIQVEPQHMDTGETSRKSNALDDLVDDPTASLSVNQAGDYLQGVVWGTGDNAITLEPSEYLLEKADASELADYFEFATKTTLDQMNHSAAGLNTAMKPYFYDQVGFGTSGIGVYRNDSYLNGQEDNALVFRSYGVDNMAIDEGKNGLVDTIFVNHRWRVNRIIEEFATKNETVDKDLLAKLPKTVQDAYKNKNVNKEYNVIQGVYKRSDYHPKLKGKRGAKYSGAWFLDDSDGKVFFEEDYKKLPIAVCRAIKIRGEIWGRSSGSLLISSIKSVNYMFAKSVEVLEKMASIPLGTWNQAIQGDSVLDTSADGLTVFNQAMMPKGAKSPVFPLIDVGDPSGLIQFLIPYLNEKITTGFKVDTLLDFNSAKDMTATESLQRYTIRGRSLAGLLQQQKTELLEPKIHRVISLLSDMNVLGINPQDSEEAAAALKKRGRGERVIPDAVVECMNEGRTWYKIKFNNELEKLTRTEALERIIQYINALGMIASMFPVILEGVKWYDMIKDINDYLGFDYFVGEDDFKKIVESIAEERKRQLAMAMAKEASEAGKNVTQSQKNLKESKIEQ